MLRNLISEKVDHSFNYSVKHYLHDINGKEYAALISEIYSYMNANYRHEYFYKNTLLNKLLIKNHNLKTTVALTELPIGKSKADFVMINGKGVVYEIKTELDTFDRLSSQVNDYYKAFTDVCIVACSEHSKKLIKNYPNKNVGIIELTKKGALNTIRETISDDSNLSHKEIFNVLHKGEFEHIIQSCGLSLPSVSQFKYYAECFKILETFNVSTLQKFMIKQLKTRNKLEIESYKNVPYELKFLVYFAQFKKRDYLELETTLQQKFRG